MVNNIHPSRASITTSLRSSASMRARYSAEESPGVTVADWSGWAEAGSAVAVLLAARPAVSGLSAVPTVCHRGSVRSARMVDHPQGLPPLAFAGALAATGLVADGSAAAAMGPKQVAVMMAMMTDLTARVLVLLPIFLTTSHIYFAGVSHSLAINVFRAAFGPLSVAECRRITGCGKIYDSNRAPASPVCG